MAFRPYWVFFPGKALNKSLKHEKCFNIWFQQKHIPHLSMFCLIQGINNYVQINTNWSYIVRICIFINLASCILLLASKKCFLTSQGLVGAGMNQSRKLEPDRRTVSDKFRGGPVVFVNSPDRLSGKLFCQPLPLRIDKSRFSVNST